MKRNSSRELLIGISVLSLLFWMISNYPAQQQSCPQALTILEKVSIGIAQNATAARRNGKDTKYILAWAQTWYGRNMSVMQFHERPFDWFKTCPKSNCALTGNRSKLDEVDAVIFVMTDLKVDDLPTPASRTHGQYYIFFLEESPTTANELWHPYQWEIRPHFFNLTFTYRLDSDIFSDDYLDIYRPHLIDPSKRDPNWFAKKHAVLWMASHCETENRRRAYVWEMRNYIPIDIIGKCGGNIPDPCPTRPCQDFSFLANYKFYLAFENSMCKEYVTEKLILALNHDVVPIVMGAARYDVLFPPKAVINVEDFVSSRALVQYLDHLIHNQSAYEEHLSWKYQGMKLWYLNQIPKPKDSGFCKLCEILHRPPESVIRKSYPKITDWLFSYQCRQPFVKFHYRSGEYNATMYINHTTI